MVTVSVSSVLIPAHPTANLPEPFMNTSTPPLLPRYKLELLVIEFKYTQNSIVKLPVPGFNATLLGTLRLLLPLNRALPEVTGVDTDALARTCGTVLPVLAFSAPIDLQPKPGTLESYAA
jgi:hypothetical protein